MLILHFIHLLLRTVLFKNWVCILISSIGKQGFLWFAQLHGFLIFWKLWRSYSWSYDFFLLGGKIYCVACVHFFMLQINFVYWTFYSLRKVESCLRVRSEVGSHHFTGKSQIYSFSYLPNLPDERALKFSICICIKRIYL